MKRKRKVNGHKERRGKRAFKRTIENRKKGDPSFKEELDHLERDTIVGIHHKSAVITWVERISKVMMTIKLKRKKAKDIKNALNKWFHSIPRNLFKSTTFDGGKEFANWKDINDEMVYLAKRVFI